MCAILEQDKTQHPAIYFLLRKYLLHWLCVRISLNVFPTRPEPVRNLKVKAGTDPKKEKERSVTNWLYSVVFC